MDRFKSYIICTSPRSGSTLLCKLLSATGVAGRPDSYFHAPSLDKWLIDYDMQRDQFTSDKAALDAVFVAAIAEGTGDTGIFGLRLQRHSFAYFTQQLATKYPDQPSDAARLQAVFENPLFIHLTREDKLEQAVSYVKAAQSGLWHKAPDGTEVERLSPPQDPVYDRKAIAAQLAASEQMDADWTAWFTAESITPLRITYDALATRPVKTVKTILNILGVAHPDSLPTALPLAKLADTTNIAWISLFKAETVPNA